MLWQECAALSGILDNGCMVKGEQKGRMSSGISDLSGYLFSCFLCGRLLWGVVGSSR